MNGAMLIATVLAYAAALFALAWRVELRGRTLSPRWRRPSYALALAVYCTSWTFYGAVGSAVATGWDYLPIYLGPILVWACGARFLERLVRSAHADGATSISDFIGSRFGKSRGVAALVTLIALTGTIPYIALQLRSVGISFGVVADNGAPGLAMAVTAAALALFAIAFGTRRYDAAGRNDGVLAAISIESLVKLAAFVAAGLFALMAFGGASPPAQAGGVAALQALFDPGRLDGDFIVITCLSAMAIVCLPRQFYIGVIEAGSPADVRAARWPFIVYLLLTAIVVLPIALAGIALAPPGARADLIILSLPMASGAELLALFVFVGGVSAATGMVVVESIALSTMISNDLVAPLLLRDRRWAGERDFGRAMLVVRRLVIAALLGVAWLYAQLIPANESLASIGLIAFAAMAQFAPALVLAVTGENRDALAAKAGLTGGLVVWLWTLALPMVMPAALLAPFHGSFIDPNALLGLDGMSPVAHGALWSLGINVALMLLVHARGVRSPHLSLALPRIGGIGGVSSKAELATLAARFVGEERALPAIGIQGPIDRASAQTAERLIAGVVGAPTARVLVGSALSGSALSMRDITRLLDRSGESLQFSKGLLAATLEHIEPGVSVIDRDLNLVAWNSRYLELFDYPDGLVRVGAPVADLIRWNALRGECGPGEVDAHVSRRLDHMRRGSPHEFERTRDDGRVLRTVGGPMPDGGYVMCFTDVTAEARTRAALIAARNELESRVATRTAELSAANARLAKADADKTRFLAAASHDLLQPLHAARLFAAAAARGSDARDAPLLDRVDKAIGAAEELLTALLDISKLDAGGIEPRPEPVAADALLADLAAAFLPQAEAKGLTLTVAGGSAAVMTDRALLRSILQNLVSNAVRYTASGSIALSAERVGDRVVIAVRDTGHGIPADKQRTIFREFERLGTGGESGVGLGLAIVERTARLIGAEIALDSAPGRGSCFTVTLPAIDAIAPSDAYAARGAPEAMPTLTLLLADDDPRVLAAMSALCASMGHAIRTASTARGAARTDAAAIDAALVDLDLGDGEDGLWVIARLRARVPDLPAALVTADRSPEARARARAAGVALLPKPLAAAELEQWLGGLGRAEAAE